MRDRKKGTTTRVSVSSKGKRANSKSYGPSISESGRYISFTSAASNLVPGDTNGVRDTFVHDRKTKKTTRVSVTSSGQQISGSYGSGFTTSISGSGRYVAFTSNPAGLAPGDDADNQAYLHDRTTGVTEPVSVTNDGLPSTATAGETVSVSEDGRLATFVSGSSGIAPGTNNGNPDVVVRDRVLATTTQVSPMHYRASSPTISRNGAVIAFTYDDTANRADLDNLCWPATPTCRPTSTCTTSPPARSA